MKQIILSARIASYCWAGFLAVSVVTETFASTLTNGLCAYWPLDNATGCNNKTPDVWSGYDMQVIYGGGNSSGFFLTNFNDNMHFTNDAARGNAIYVNNNTPAFNGVGNNGMALAFKSVNTNDLVPINRYSPNSNTVSFWITTDNQHPIPNSDQRVWCESDYIRTYASVIDLSPTTSGYDLFLRQTPPGGGSLLRELHRWQSHHGVRSDNRWSLA